MTLLDDPRPISADSHALEGLEDDARDDTIGSDGIGVGARVGSRRRCAWRHRYWT